LGRRKIEKEPRSNFSGSRGECLGAAKVGGDRSSPSQQVWCGFYRNRGCCMNDDIDSRGSTDYGFSVKHISPTTLCAKGLNYLFSFCDEVIENLFLQK
jgi:hypothetical protein